MLFELLFLNSISSILENINLKNFIWKFSWQTQRMRIEKISLWMMAKYLDFYLIYDKSNDIFFNFTEIKNFTIFWAISRC